MRLPFAVASILLSTFACAARCPPQPAAPPAASAAPRPLTRAALPTPSTCGTDRDCPINEHCACPAAGVPDARGNTMCGGPSLCYPAGVYPQALP